MAYATASDVMSYTPNILGGAQIYDETTVPTEESVETWLSSGCAIIESTLSDQNYTVPVSNGTVAYDWIKNLNAIYAAAQAELSRANVTLAPGERTRGQVFDEMFWAQLTKLQAGNLTLAGLTRSSTAGKLYAGGISVTNKQSNEDDTDMVKPRFGRKQFQFPGVIEPTTSTASQS